ncbi:MAG TPA: M20/M25/M40 family metallo-hydrolase [Bacillales bacterium]|nr:M20/M25/M40 family metallo-hydrolase [Bacillales bacterium]
MAQWQTKNQLTELLTQLVEYQSITGSPAEIAISEYLHLRLRELGYFQENPQYLQLHPTADGRKFITALVKKKRARKTVVLVSHFDVVDVEDYGEWKNLAFRPKELTNEFRRSQDLPEEVSNDIANGDWLFGRGTMDMKAGIALHMAMIEQACDGRFDGNVMLLSVPDEEVNSTGMIEAVEVLLELAGKYDLSYTACLNSEPIFTSYPGDDNYYVYSGSVGKVLPGFFCYGKETHAGEPFAGLNANFMVSELTRALELNTTFCEQVEGENTPPPTNLMQKDLKDGYSVQSPHSAVTNFNLLTMEQPLENITDQLLKLAGESAERIQKHYLERVKQYNRWQSFDPVDFDIRVLTYEKLWAMAVERYGRDEIERRQAYIIANFKELGDRDLSTRLVFDLAALCKDQSPMIVLFYNPPFYPAVSSRHEPVILRTINHIMEYAHKKHGVSLKHKRFFPGLSDLSFTGMNQTANALYPLVNNMPLYGNGYDLPFDAMRALNIPVMNLGPLGKDAHQWTERLQLDYSFATLPGMLRETIAELLKDNTPEITK